MAYEQILYTVADSIATITLNRPDKLNAWTATMEREVRFAVEQAETDGNKSMRGGLRATITPSIPIDSA